MKYSLIATLLLTLFAGMAYARDFDTRGLTTAQIAEFKAQMATAQAVNAQTSVAGETLSSLPSAEELTKYAELGEAIAKGLGAAAKELGMAVDEFLGTTAGMIVAMLIVYNFIGSDLITMFIGFFVMIPLTYAALRKVLFWIRLESYEYDENGKRHNKFNNMSGDDGGAVDMQAIIWAYIVWLLATLLQVMFYLP